MGKKGIMMSFLICSPRKILLGCVMKPGR